MESKEQNAGTQGEVERNSEKQGALYCSAAQIDLEEL